jgi:uncharacterized protein YcfL
MKKYLSLFIVLLMIFAVGCSKKSESTLPSKGISSQAPNYGLSSDNDTKTVNTASSPKAPNSTLQNSQKKIIQTGEIFLIVEDIKESNSSIRNKANELNGYIESENISENSSNTRIRIPSDKLDIFIEYVNKNYDVRNQQMSAQDITDTYVDNEARLKNFKAQESQTLEILKKANTVEDILKVQSEISKLRGEIEALESRKNIWDKDIEFSTIRISSSKKSIAIESKIKALSGSEFFRSISKGFLKSTATLILVIQNIIIFFISNIIILFILAVSAIIIYRKYMKKK